MGAMLWLSQPDGIPVRIVADTFHQVCPHGVADYVARHCLYVFVMAHCMVMECPRPYRPFGMAGLVHETCACGLQSGDYAGQRPCLPQLHQPVCMVGHQYPREQRGIPE